MFKGVKQNTQAAQAQRPQWSELCMPCCWVFIPPFLVFCPFTCLFVCQLFLGLLSNWSPSHHAASSGPLPFWFSWACGCCLSSLLALPACCFESKERRAKKQKEKEEAEGEGRKKEEAEEEGEEGGSRGSRTPTTNALSFFGTNQLLTHTNGGSTNAHNQAEYCAKHRWPKTSDKTKPQQKEELAGCLPTFIASARQRKPKQREIQFRPDVVPLLFSLVSQATVCHHLRAFIQTTVVLRGGEGLIRAFP